jgi:hypothetical protein
MLWIFLLKFKFKEGISLFLYEILEFDMTTYYWIINIDLCIKLRGLKEIHKTQGINYVQHLTRIIPKNSSPFLAESALPHKHSPLHCGISSVHVMWIKIQWTYTIAFYGFWLLLYFSFKLLMCARARVCIYIYIAKKTPCIYCGHKFIAL